ncbi:hypothetical protein MMC26_004120 [Xylographa opegraphella]|nr:hypothetical protein [Xylographa opegraphella]
MYFPRLLGFALGVSSVRAIPATSQSTTSLACQTQSQPNPIAAEYPTLTTGTINGTVAVLPIEYTLARSIIPAQYPILNGYKHLLPGFPTDKYPLIIESVLDHDVQANSITIADFSRVVLSFPFIDLLGDGYSNFRYEKYVLITPNPVAMVGAAAYGEIPVPSTFEPPCDGYAFKPGSNMNIFFNAYQGLDQALGRPPTVAVEFEATRSAGPYPLNFYMNVTNQPSFSTGVLCDNFITLYNSTVTEGQYAPVVVVGNVSVAAPYLPTAMEFTGIYGLKIDRAFIENNYMACSRLKGYTGSGSGD